MTTLRGAYYYRFTIKTVIHLSSSGTQALAASSNSLLSIPVLSWQGDWALGPSSRTPLATCLFGARAPMTHFTYNSGPRSPGIATTFTATRQLCYFRLREPTLQCVVFVSDVTECTRIPTTWMVGFCFALHGHEAQHICVLPEQWNNTRSGRDEQHGLYLWC